MGFWPQIVFEVIFVTDTEIKIIFSQRLRMRLEELGMTQKDLCEKTGIDKSLMSRYFNGVYTPRLEMLIVLSNALQCTPNDLMEGLYYY